MIRLCLWQSKEQNRDSHRRRCHRRRCRRRLTLMSVCHEKQEAVVAQNKVCGNGWLSVMCDDDVDGTHPPKFCMSTTIIALIAYHW